MIERTSAALRWGKIARCSVDGRAGAHAPRAVNALLKRAAASP